MYKVCQLFCFILFLFGFTPAVAQGEKVNSPSASDPLGVSSFLGIELDNPFPGEMQKCPQMKWMDVPDREAASKLGEVCFYPKSDTVFEVLNGPDLGIGHTLEISTFQQMPISFRLGIGSKRFDQLVEIFTEKYGPSHRKFSEPWQTVEGRKLLSRVQQWEGARLRIRVDEYGDEVYWGKATVENVKLRDVLEDRVKDAVRKAARKL